jgi:hypothetical protein
MNMPKLIARTQSLNKIMGSRSTDIGELRQSAEGCLEEQLPDLATCSDEEFQRVQTSLARYWPSYMAYHREEERNAQ